MLRGLLEHLRCRLVRRLDRRRELPRARFRVLEELGEPGVNLGAPGALGDLVRARGEEWVREADPVVVELDDLRLERRAKPDVWIDPRRRFCDGDGRVRMRRGCEEKAATLRRERQQSAVDELLEGLGDRQGLAALGRDAAALQGADDLQGVERVAGGRLPHLGQERTRQGHAQVCLHHMVERGGIERPDLDVGHPLRGQRARQLSDKRALDPRTARQQHTDRLGTKPPGCVRESRGRGRVEPLDVVHGHDEGPLFRERPECGQERHADRVRVGRWALVVTDDERTRQRSGLGGRQRRERLVEHGIEQVSDAGERERRLALGRARGEHEVSLGCRLCEPGLPERGLPGAGVAFEHERDGSRGNARREVAKRRTLVLASHDARGHDASIVSPIGGRAKGDAHRHGGGA